MHWLDHLAGSGCGCDGAQGYGPTGAGAAPPRRIVTRGAPQQQQAQQRMNPRAAMILRQLDRVNKQIAAMQAAGTPVNPRLAQRLARLQQRLQQAQARGGRGPFGNISNRPRPERPAKVLPGQQVGPAVPATPAAPSDQSDLVSDFEGGGDDLDFVADTVYGGGTPSTSPAQTAQDQNQGVNTPTPVDYGPITDSGLSVDPDLLAAYGSFVEDGTPANKQGDYDIGSFVDAGDVGPTLDLDVFAEVAGQQSGESEPDLYGETSGKPQSDEAAFLDLFGAGAVDLRQYEQYSVPDPDAPQSPAISSDLQEQWLESARQTATLFKISPEAIAQLQSQVTQGTEAQWNTLIQSYFDNMNATVKNVDTRNLRDYSADIERVQQAELAVLFASQVFKGRGFAFDPAKIDAAITHAQEFTLALTKQMQSDAFFNELRNESAWMDGLRALQTTDNRLALLWEGTKNNVIGTAKQALEAVGPLVAGAGAGILLLALLFGALALSSKR